MYRSAFLSCVGLMALTTGGAGAQSLSAPLPVPNAGWTGAYGGVLAGAGFGANRWTDAGGFGIGWSAPPGTSYNTSTVGAALGLFAGYNWQVSPMFVVGVEADITYNTANGQTTINPEPATVVAHANFAGSLRGRAGLAVDRALIYVTGGLALGNPSQRWAEASGAAWRSDGFRAGYVIGAGVEVMLSPQWTVRAEALHYDFGARTAKDVTPASSFDSFMTPGYIMRARSSQTQVRAGAAYRF